MNSFQLSVNEKMPGGRMPGRRQRERDPPHGPEAGRAVDARALLQLGRDRLEVAGHQPRAERRQKRRVDQDQRQEVVLQVQRLDHLEHRDEQQRRGHQVGREDRQPDEAGAAEAKSRQRVAGWHAQQQRDGGSEDGDDHRVAGPGWELGGRQQLLVVLERWMEHEHRVAGGAVQLRVRLQRRDQHPVERRQQEQQHEGQRQIQGEQSIDAAGNDRRPASLTAAQRDREVAAPGEASRGVRLAQVVDLGGDQDEQRRQHRQRDRRPFAQASRSDAHLVAERRQQVGAIDRPPPVSA